MTYLLLAFALSAPVLKDTTTANWAEFRGPNGTGHYTGPAVPETWGPDTHVAWKTSIPGKGWSSPVLMKGKLYLTTAVPKGEGKQVDQELRVLCVDAASGSIDWNELVFLQEGKSAPSPHAKNSHASPTAITDGERVYVHFGHMGTACYDLAGKQVWATQKHTYKPQHGNGGSPILVDGKLVFCCDGTDQQFVLALDAKTGEQAWKTDRKSKAKMRFSFSTCQFVEHAGRRMIVSPAADFIAAYDPTTGEELWRANYPQVGWSLINRPVYTSGLIVFSTGYDSPILIAVDPSGSGDVTATHIKWQYKKFPPNTPSPIAIGDHVYSLSDKGMMVCLDAKTGKVHWEEKVKGNGFSSSPVLVNGKLYITSEDGKGTVIEPDAKELKATDGGDMKEKTFATFVPHNGALYLRTESKLYKFQK
ncbi:MAG: PQQ-like beta-propeller repeat protein [Fimbriiglobus sp.]|jgi:outer membrane protein assembly factor BamB|nr:PQQ-like beta-propeller repeat protein [Fimbriiglobus sp.]